MKANAQVLFVSVGGGGRALMGAALLQRRVGDAVTVYSAGSGESAEIPKNVREVMEEIGCNLDEAYTRPLTPEVLANADIVVTMARSVGEVQVPHNVRHLDWRVGNPGDAELYEVRRVREDIERRVESLAEELSAAMQQPASTTA